MKRYIILGFALVLVVSVLIYGLVRYGKNTTNVTTSSSTPIATQVSQPTITLGPTPTPTPTAAQASLYYPMSNYAARLTIRKYGQSVKAEDRQQFPCGAPFSGWHTGDDLETTPDEAKIDV